LVPALAGVGRRPVRRLGPVVLWDREAEGPPHARALRAEMDGDRAADLAGGDVERAEPGHGLHGIAHRVRAELAPALAPEVRGGVGAVDGPHDLGQLGRPRADLQVVLAGAEHVVTLVATALHAALDLSRLPAGDPDLGHDQPDRALRSGDARHDQIGPAVL